MKKIALAAVVVLFVAAAGFVAYQRMPVPVAVLPDQIFIYNCDDETQITFSTNNNAQPPAGMLTWKDQEIAMTLQESASGAHYVAGSGQTFWSKGEDATVQWADNQAPATCKKISAVTRAD